MKNKMKEILIIIISLAIVFTGSYISQNYLNKSSNDLVGNLQDLKKEIGKAQLNKENNSAKLVEKIYNKWKKTEEKWSVIILHNELDLIETSLVGMKARIEQKKYEEAVEELEKSIFLIDHIKEREKFALKNVF